MENSRKQRLVGAAVLVALAAIFLPALFDRDERVAIDTTSQIPPAPVIEPVNIPKPTKPESIQPPPPEKLFQPDIVDEPALAEENSSEPIVEATKKESQAAPVATPDPTPQAPSLNEKGVPRAWVIQAASFKSQEAADKFTQTLIAAKYKAYTQAVNTAKGEFFRVLIGPYIDEQKAINDKQLIDRGYKLRSRVLRFNPIAD